MKKVTAMMLAFSTIFITCARAQDFTNLNFQLAQNLPGDPPIPDGVDVAATNALQDWTAFDGSLALSEINYVSNYISGVATSVELEGGSLALSGNSLSVGLYPGGYISQTGMVPANAESIEFEGSGVPESGTYSVTLGGQTLSFSALSEGPDYNVYGANIPSDMDGDVEALTFSCQGSGSGNVLLDDIDFSSSPVPEPGTLALSAVGGLLLAWRRWRK